jgi:hypothetical protein
MRCDYCKHDYYWTEFRRRWGMFFCSKRCHAMMFKVRMLRAKEYARREAK